MIEKMTKHIVIAGMGDIGQRLIATDFNQPNRNASFGKQPVLYDVKYYGIKRSPFATQYAQIINADLVRMNCQDKLSLSKLPKVIDCLIYTLTPSEMTPEGYNKAYVLSYQQLMQELTDRYIEVKKVFFISSTGVYGQNNHEWIDEASPTLPLSFSGKILLEAEKNVLKHEHHHCIRLSGIYGRSDADVYRNRYIRLLHEGKVYAKEPIHYSNRIHIDDIIHSIIYLLKYSWQDNPPLAPIILVSDDQPTPLHDIHAWLFNAIPEEKKPFASLDDLSEIEMKRQVSSKRCNNHYLKSLGYQFIRPNYEAGFKELLDDIKTL